MHQASYPLPYTRTDTAIYLLSVLAVALVLGLSWSIEPSTRGFGTHVQLGLPPCWFLRLTGLPCPSCGLTTCFAHAAKLHFGQAAAAQPFGVIQFAMLAGALPGIPYLMARRISLDRIATWNGMPRAIWTWTVLYLSSWMYKIAAMSS